jgi:hypothetical protein
MSILAIAFAGIFATCAACEAGQRKERRRPQGKPVQSSKQSVRYIVQVAPACAGYKLTSGRCVRLSHAVRAHQ